MITVIIFLMTYTGITLGRIPGLQIDRTGIALLGAIAMMACGAVPLNKICQAIDLPTILLLYALMIISAQLRLGGFYTWTALRCTKLLNRPRYFLLAVMAVSAALSALLANDIVCLAFTPVLAVTLTAGGINPIPFLLGLAVASNIGSAATIIGNPQNMLIGQVGNLSFGGFLAWSLPPSFLALVLAFGYICLQYGKGFSLPVSRYNCMKNSDDWPAFDRWQSGKGLCAITAVLILFFSDIPREFSALSIAGLLLLSRRMRSRQILSLVDWHLITLFLSLFIVIHGIASGNLVPLCIESLKDHGIVMTNMTVLVLVSTLLSNLASNVPAVMVLIGFLNPADPTQWYVLATSSTFAGNLLLIGSIANLIVAEQARTYGITISFKEHAKTGIPVTIISLVVLLLWIRLA